MTLVYVSARVKNGIWGTDGQAYGIRHTAAIVSCTDLFRAREVGLHEGVACSRVRGGRVQVAVALQARAALEPARPLASTAQKESEVGNETDSTPPMHTTITLALSLPEVQLDFLEL